MCFSFFIYSQIFYIMFLIQQNFNLAHQKIVLKFQKNQVKQQFFLDTKNNRKISNQIITSVNILLKNKTQKIYIYLKDIFKFFLQRKSPNINLFIFSSTYYNKKQQHVPNQNIHKTQLNLFFGFNISQHSRKKIQKLKKKTRNITYKKFQHFQWYTNNNISDYTNTNINIIIIIAFSKNSTSYLFICPPPSN
eukprot:TRINITY_DN17365_c0_g1_i3.p2 TRINITY_DN17365_c0_g1~~TRINITY_DN17365_c0_g1_i3.p2  ORF type:complete len:192 (-),score=-8.26 TRINITY_DN17365_c0_g1_i3:366-941(-)